ncbi:hypothetical protein BLNAU_21828 [Blattamonas nauphoetae]|uniref:Uncharacterized protein n=1 Tax=Blattamonas nauphoetae TaxID=2049346 RepID=A0ABQ9WXX5_9EUKA|nr:hypothetical protein BLNAU_21828 [Blattamonas nauphoetae]
MTLHPTSSKYSIHCVSFVDPTGQVNLSSFSNQHLLKESRCDVSIPIPAPLVTLPPPLFTDRSHFIIKYTTLTRSMVTEDESGFASSSTALIEEPITTGIVTITITLLSLPIVGRLIGLLDSTAPIPKLGEMLGFGVNNSLSLISSTGYLCRKTQSLGYNWKIESCHFFLKEGDCVRMEVDMESTLRTVQFFVNGESGRCFVSGLPQSVRIGFSVSGQGTSFRIDRISKQQSPTLFTPEMREIMWK